LVQAVIAAVALAFAGCESGGTGGGPSPASNDAGSVAAELHALLAHDPATPAGRDALVSAATDGGRDARVRYAALRRLEATSAPERIGASETAAREAGASADARLLAMNALAVLERARPADATARAAIERLSRDAPSDAVRERAAAALVAAAPARAEGGR